MENKGNSLRIENMWTDNRSPGTNTKKGLLIHHTGVIGEGNVSMPQKDLGSGSVSYHYLVMQDGRVYKYGEHDYILWHAGEGKIDGKTYNRNGEFIGIEVESDGYLYTDIQRERTAELIRSIAEEESIPAEKIVRHLDISGYRGKWDVSDAFWEGEHSSWEEYVLSIMDDSMTKSQTKSKIASIDLALTENGEAREEGTEEERKSFTTVNNVHRRRKEGFEKILSTFE